jgi:hypothetical protein
VLRDDDFRKTFDVTGSGSGGIELDEVVGHLLLVVIVGPEKKKTPLFPGLNLSVTKIISLAIMNLVTPKVRAKHELLFNKLRRVC